MPIPARDRANSTRRSVGGRGHPSSFHGLRAAAAFVIGRDRRGSEPPRRLDGGQKVCGPSRGHRRRCSRPDHGGPRLEGRPQMGLVVKCCLAQSSHLKTFRGTQCQASISIRSSVMPFSGTSWFLGLLDHLRRYLPCRPRSAECIDDDDALYCRSNTRTAQDSAAPPPY